MTDPRKPPLGAPTFGLSLVVAATLAACAVGPDYTRPELVAPVNWRTPQEAAPVADLANLAWWREFGDPALANLVELALKNNQDLKIAVARLRQYEARADVYSAQQWPEVAIQGRSSRDRLSEERQAPLSAHTPISSANYELQARVSWELDLWGRVKRSNEAALADLLAVDENRRAVALTVVSDVVSTYVDLLSLDQELALLRADVINRQETLRLQAARQGSGGSSMLPVQQAQAVLDEVLATIPAKEREMEAKENALSILLGTRPAAVARTRRQQDLLVPAVPQGLPSDVLAQRPDVRQAEQNLIAANARIGVAKAEYFPTISLTGSAGFASTDLSRFISAPATIASAGTDLLAKVFTGGRVDANVREAQAVRLEQLETYRKLVLNAFFETEDALVYQRKSKERLSLFDRQVRDAQLVLASTQSRFQGGLGTQFDVLEAQRQLTSAERSRTLAQHDLQLSAVRMYKAMGGGWKVAAPEVISVAASTDKN